MAGNINITTDQGTGNKVIQIQLPGSPGPRGIQGVPGQANILTIGTITTGAPGSSASATISGVSPAQTLNLTVPQGPKGDTGAAGQPNTLTIGTVNTVNATTGASATITGTAPNQTLNLVVPRGYGVIPAGVAGDVLVKNTATDYDTKWDTPSSDPTHGAIVRRDSSGGFGAAYVWSQSSPNNPEDLTRKDYVDAAASNLQTQVTANTNNISTNTTNIGSNTTALGAKVQIGGDLGGTITAPTVTGGTHHTHTSSQVSDAASAATASMVMKRDAAGRAQVADPSVAADIATKNYVDNASALNIPLTQKGAASGVPSLDATSGLLVPGYEDITELAAAPANPAAGHSRLYFNTNHRMVSLDSTGQLRPYGAYVGTGTAFPTTLLVVNDVFIRTDVGTNGTMYRYTGVSGLGSSGWVAEGRIVCLSTTRPTAGIYAGLAIYETDTGRTYTYSGTAWVYSGGAAPALTNVTWANVAVFTDWDTTNFGRVKYGVDASGRVVIQGLMKVAAASQPAFGTTLFTLPTGLRPATTQMVSGINQSNQTPVRFDVITTGAVNFQGGVAAANQFIDLSTVGFWPANN